tara:strand:+ start:1152 stop:1781 length:630 start_codon:yes stop_codon:yes gene_type:complete
MFYNIKTKKVLNYTEMLEEANIDRPINLSDRVLQPIGYLNVSYVQQGNLPAHTKWKYGKVTLVDGKPVSNMTSVPLTGEALKESKARELMLVENKKIEDERRYIIKRAIKIAIDTLRVEVNGNGFDADEKSIIRMSVAISTLADKEHLLWRLYSNDNRMVSKEDFKLAMSKGTSLGSKLFFASSMEEIDDIVSTDSIWLEKYNRKLKED